MDCMSCAYVRFKQNCVTCFFLCAVFRHLGVPERLSAGTAAQGRARQAVELARQALELAMNRKEDGAGDSSDMDSLGENLFSLMSPE